MRNSKRFGFMLASAAAILLVAVGAGSPPERGLFRDITKQSGIDVRVTGDLRRLKLIPTMIGGCAFGDYDGDGLPDLYVTNSIPSWGKPNEKSCGRLYRNLGGGRFEDATAKSGVKACGLGMGAFWVDLDGDGKLDLYLTNVGRNTVWWNRGDGTFEQGKDTGLEDPLFSVGAAFLDYDGDGRVDVVVGNYLDTTPEWEAAQPQFELRVPEDYKGQPSHLYRNLGGRKFRDVTAEAHLVMDPASTKTLGVAVLDYDGDGRPDLYFVNDRASNRLFHNKGDGTFEETTEETGAGAFGRQPRAGMGVAVGDAFGDGRPSLFVTNFGNEPNTLYRNVEGALFEDAGTALGAGPVGEPYVRWGTHFADFDNDGWPDLYAVGGHLAPKIVRTVGHYRTGEEEKARYVQGGDRSYAQTTVVLRNVEGKRFEAWPDSGDLSRARMVGRGSAVADVDGDGDLDLFIVDIAGRARLFENGSNSRNAWIAIEPRPGPDARTVLGTKVRVVRGAHSSTAEFYPSASYASGTLVPTHFGLGPDPSNVRVEVTWPGGAKEAFDGVAPRRIYTVTPGKGLTPRQK